MQAKESRVEIWRRSNEDDFITAQLNDRKGVLVKYDTSMPFNVERGFCFS